MWELRTQDQSMSQANMWRAKAVPALRNSSDDTVNEVPELTMCPSEQEDLCGGVSKELLQLGLRFVLFLSPTKLWLLVG